MFSWTNPLEIVNIQFLGHLIKYSQAHSQQWEEATGWVTTSSYAVVTYNVRCIHTFTAAFCHSNLLTSWVPEQDHVLIYNKLVSIKLVPGVILVVNVRTKYLLLRVALCFSEEASGTIHCFSRISGEALEVSIAISSAAVTVNCWTCIYIWCSCSCTCPTTPVNLCRIVCPKGGGGVIEPNSNINKHILHHTEYEYNTAYLPNPLKWFENNILLLYNNERQTKACRFIKFCSLIICNLEMLRRQLECVLTLKMDLLGSNVAWLVFCLSADLFL